MVDGDNFKPDAFGYKTIAVSLFSLFKRLLTLNMEFGSMAYNPTLNIKPI